jgi:hypothetical protein
MDTAKKTFVTEDADLKLYIVIDDLKIYKDYFVDLKPGEQKSYKTLNLREAILVSAMSLSLFNDWNSIMQTLKYVVDFQLERNTHADWGTGSFSFRPPNLKVICDFACDCNSETNIKQKLRIFVKLRICSNSNLGQYILYLPFISLGDFNETFRLLSFMPIHITDEPRSFVKKYPKIKKRHF